MSESPRHDLDQVIDRVAAKMVAVDADAGLLSRTVARLPERAATPWFMSMRVQVAAAATIVAVALVYPRPSREFAPLESATESAPLALEKPAEVRPEAPVGGPGLAAVRRLPTPDSHLRQGFGAQARLPAAAPDRPDHERSLPPVDAVEALELVGIATLSLEVESAAAIEPIVLTELALDTEGEE